eukprot:scaffold23.g4095.t1
MASFNSYLQAVANAINRQNGPQLRELIALSNPAAQQAARQANPRWNPGAAAGRLPEGWGEFLAFHCACLAALLDGNRVEAYDKAVAALQPFIRVFREDSDAWVVQPMHSVVHNLRSVAEVADQELEAAGKRAEKTGDCGDQLRKCFSASLQAPGNRDKKLAALDIVNVSIKIYFRLEHAAALQEPAAHGAGRGVARAHAQECLEYALRHCHKDAQANKAMVLKYLVPVQLLLGLLPSAALVERYSLQQYLPITQVMVVAKADPFPALSSVSLTDAGAGGSGGWPAPERSPLRRLRGRRAAALARGRQREGGSIQAAPATCARAALSAAFRGILLSNTAIPSCSYAVQRQGAARRAQPGPAAQQAAGRAQLQQWGGRRRGGRARAVTLAIVRAQAAGAGEIVEVAALKGIRMIKPEEEGQRPRVEYLVQWKDGSPDTWEPASNLADNLLREYEQRWWSSVKKGDEKELFGMMDRGAPVLARTVDENRRSALHFAAALGKAELVARLAKAGAEMKQRGTSRAYLLRWEDGLPDSWEPEENVSPDLIRLWEEEAAGVARAEGADVADAALAGAGAA